MNRLQLPVNQSVLRKLSLFIVRSTWTP